MEENPAFRRMMESMRSLWNSHTRRSERREILETAKYIRTARRDSMSLLKRARSVEAGVKYE